MATTACGSTGPDDEAGWGSDQASLTVGATGATLRIRSSTDCFGSFGEIPAPLPAGSFTLSGTFTQLMGVQPGFVEYPAQFSGTVAGRHMILSLEVPALQRTLGPFILTRGADENWVPCLFP